MAIGELGAEVQRELFENGIGVRGVAIPVFLPSLVSSIDVVGRSTTLPPILFWISYSATAF